MNTQQYVSELKDELINILQFWMKNTVDEDSGGFIGKIDHNNHVDDKAAKGCVLNARILWTFAAAYNACKNEQYLQMAERAFQYLKEYFVDGQYGGVFWSVDHKGNPLDTKKQIYAQAFAIYGCSEYYKAAGAIEAKDIAIELYNSIEKYSYDPLKGGYFEAFTREWAPIADLRLSEKDANEKKTMNTHLHVLEAYTNLYHIAPEVNIRRSIVQLLNDFTGYIIDRKSSHLHLFMDEDWNVKGNIISYGHDIEATWLLLEAAEVIDDQELIETMKVNAVKMADAAAEGLDADGGLWHERETGHLVREKHWWPQAEAMVGFVNAWQLTQNEKYLQWALRTWEFIKQHIIDKHNGEWFWGVRADYTLIKEEDKVGPWKCPYHNARACLEISRRLS